jgi:hypothetical protein
MSPLDEVRQRGGPRAFSCSFWGGAWRSENRGDAIHQRALAGSKGLFPDWIPRHTLATPWISAWLYFQEASRVPPVRTRRAGLRYVSIGDNQHRLVQRLRERARQARDAETQGLIDRGGGVPKRGPLLSPELRRLSKDTPMLTMTFGGAGRLWGKSVHVR